MSTSTGDTGVRLTGTESRVLREGYGVGAWHGPDLASALDDVTPPLAFWRPAAGRHSIAEIALHHAYCVHAVRARLSGRQAEPFVVPGEDWFEVNGGLSWSDIRRTVETEHHDLVELIGRIEAGAATSAVPEPERFGLVLGITCHAVYHAGQVQLIKRLHGG